MPTREEILHFLDDDPHGADPWVIPPSRAVIEIVEPDAAWPTHAEVIRRRITAALGPRALGVEHVGSTSVAGLPAKPIIDLDLTVADPGHERRWLPQLEAIGFQLTVREPWWYEHRMLRSIRSASADPAPTDTATAAAEPAANVHVFGPDSPELIRHRLFRDWLRADAADRALYASVKRSAAATSMGNGQLMTEYNARKQVVLREIYERAFRAAGFLD